jgi:hypothetical protein
MTNTVLTNAPEPGANMVTQYAFVPNGRPVALPYPAISPYISYAGDVNSTAGDMAKWLIAHIQEGRGIEKPILAAKTFELMHRRHRGNHPDMSGFGMKFFTYDYNGERILEHYGSIQHRSLEIMMLDRKIGVFLTMAGGGPPGPRDRIPVDAGPAPITGSVEAAVSHSGARALIMEHFLGRLPFQQDVSVDSRKYIGRYQNIANRSGGILVEDSGDGGLVIDGRKVYRPSGPDTFTLDRTLPLEAGFGVSNKYVFVRTSSGAMRMFGHVNAGGFEKVEEK